MGRLIPAGTGMARYQNIGIQIDAPEELLEGPEEEEVPAQKPAGADEGAAALGEGLMASGGPPRPPFES